MTMPTRRLWLRTRRSIVVSLVLGLTAVALLAFSSVAALLYWSLQRELVRAENREIDGKADVVKHFVDEMPDAQHLQELRHHLDDVLIGAGRLHIWLISDDGAVVYGGSYRPQTRTLSDGWLDVEREDGVRLRGRSMRADATTALPGVEMLVALDTRDRDELLRTYRNALLSVCGLALAMTIASSTWVARRALRPIKQLSKEAAAITPLALSVRLSGEGAVVELQALVHSFNMALDRVQAAYEHLEAFSADVAHELRTPLTTMISGVEVTLARDRSNDELRDMLASSLDDLRQLAAMVNDMLFLAEADRGHIERSMEALALRDEADRVSEYFEAILEDRRQTIQIHGHALVTANARLVRRALVNLVSNASRYAGTGGVITIELSQQAQGARLSVKNSGPPIAPELMPRLFDRFFRADAARQDSAEHHGLGLAIVRAVARVHAGDTFAHSANGFTEVGFTVGTGATYSARP